MLADRIEAKWIDAFCEIFERCAVKPGDTAAILSETQSRALNVHLAELALLRMGARPFHVVVPTPRNRQIVPVRSTGASEAIQRLGPVVTALQQAGFVVDCTIEGLMHAVETPEILKAGARILVISNEHPEALERMVPDPALEKRVRAAAKMLRGTKRMRVTSKAGTDLDVDMVGASTVGVWGWTDKPGTLAHWPGGIVVSFPKSGTDQRHAGDGAGRHQPHLQALSDVAGQDDAEGRLRHRAGRRGRRCRDDARLSRGLGRPRGLCGVACRLRHESRRALRGAVDVRPARHQRHGDCAPSPAISCSRPAPTNSPAATPRAISICR